MEMYVPYHIENLIINKNLTFVHETTIMEMYVPYHIENLIINKNLTFVP